MEDCSRMSGTTIVSLLLAAGMAAGCSRSTSKYETQGVSREQALMAAAKAGDDLAVEAFLKKNVDVNAKGPTGSTALHAAAGGGHTQTVRLLLDRGANANAA